MIKFITYSKDDKIEVLGHIFKGIDEIDSAVEVETRILNSVGERYIRRIEPKKPVEGIHILKLYEPYPRFDDSDYDYETRRYNNYFFSDKPFSDKDIEIYAGMPQSANNYCMVFEGMSEGTLPAAYFGGSSRDKLIIAIQAENSNKQLI